MSKHWLCLTRLKAVQLTLCIQAPSCNPYESDPPCPVTTAPTEIQEKAKLKRMQMSFLNTSHIKQLSKEY